MLFGEHPIVVRGGGDLATGVVYRLWRAGFPVVVTELARPLTIRRTVAVSSAVSEGEFRVEGLTAVRVDSAAGAVATALSGRVPVLVDSGLPELPDRPFAVIDARLAKRNIDTSIGDAPLVVGLGPGFSAGVDCHAVVETMRGHRLGRVILDGSAAPDTGVPGVVGGESEKRVVRASTSGTLVWRVAIGDAAHAGEVLGEIGGEAIEAPLSGVVRGLLSEGETVRGLKIADIDPRADASACFEISDKSLAVGGGVLEAVLAWLGRKG